MPKSLLYSRPHLWYVWSGTINAPQKDLRLVFASYYIGIYLLKTWTESYDRNFGQEHMTNLLISSGKVRNMIVE